jgi:hypothetical protein
VIVVQVSRLPHQKTQAGRLRHNDAIDTCVRPGLLSRSGLRIRGTSIAVSDLIHRRSHGQSIA